MATVLNRPDLAYYQRRNNVRLPRRAESKKFIDVTGIAIVPSILFSQPYPWEAFTTQTQVNDFVEELDLDVPPGWFAMTLVAKKAYLAATYGETPP